MRDWYVMMDFVLQQNLLVAGRLLRCVRCPTAYHTGDFCIAAGSENLPGNNIVCSKHFQPNRTQKYHTHINVSWCFVCNLGKPLDSSICKVMVIMVTLCQSQCSL